MKKNILLAFCCCSLLAFTACSDDYNDATSKHVYGENENPYLKIDTEAQISATGALEVNGEHSYTASNPQLSSSASFLRLNVLSSLN